MVSFVKRLARGFDRGEKARLTIFYAAIALMHIAGWGILLSLAPQYPALLGLGGIAYSFGLRHAFDADHISAIDNTTRKLLQAGGKPVGVGFFFSLGHSTVVFLISLALGLAVKTVVDNVVSDSGQLSNLGGLISSSVSAIFLLLIGILNLIVLLDIIAAYRRMKHGKYNRSSLEEHLVTGGVLTRLFSRLFRLISQSWQVYPIGFLFGLGFDTASEVALLAMSASASSNGMPISAVIALSLIFAAAMTLMDTTDGAFMAKAYSWAFSNPTRKLFYNLTMTSLSVFIALFVGAVEVLQVLSQFLGLDGGLWQAIGNLDMASLGLIIVVAFVLTWVLALLLFRFWNVEERWNALVDS